MRLEYRIYIRSGHLLAGKNPSKFILLILQFVPLNYLPMNTDAVASTWLFVRCDIQALKLLDEEETTDNELRAKFSQRWNRTPSGDLYKPLRAGTLPRFRHPNSRLFPAAMFCYLLCCPLEGANFRGVLDKAIQADQVVKERYNTHCEMIALLCKPENELNAAIPSANPTKTLQGSEVRPPLTPFRSGGGGEGPERVHVATAFCSNRATGAYSSGPV